MARVHPIFPSFTAGELSPLVWGRIDFEKYNSGARQLVNFFPRPHGPVTRRPGTRFVCEVKDSTKKTVLLPFEFSTDQAYAIEFGAGYMRFLKDGGRIELVVSGCANNGSGLIRVTTSVAHTMTTGMRVVVAGVVGTTEANGTWTVTNVDATHLDLQGSAFVNAYVSGGAVIPDVSTPYTEAELYEVKYVQSADTLYLFHREHPVQKLVRFSHTDWRLKAVNFLPPATYEDGYFDATKTLTFGATTGLGVALTASAALFLEADVGRVVSVGDGRAIIRSIGGVGPHASATVDIVDALPSTGPHATWLIGGSPVAQLTPSAAQPQHQITTLTLDKNGWRSSDVGRYVRVNKGVVKITKFTSATVVEGEILAELLNVVAAAGGSWNLESAAWNATRGYPQAGCFDDQRLVVGGSKAQPDSFWGSQSADLENFGFGPDDDDAYEFKIAANDVNAIRWLVPTRALLIGTASTEFRVLGNADGAVVPTSVDAKAQSFWGSSTVRPLRVASAVLYVPRYGKELRELVYQYENDQYQANDLLLLAEHLTRDFGIIDMTYQRTPHSMVWAVREDGVLLCLTYQRDHSVVAWSRSYTGQDHLIAGSPVKGKFEAVASTPHWDGKRAVTWLVVQRSINGASKRFIEYMDETGGFYGALNVDCGLVYSGAPATTFTGLSHLNGEQVQIVGDGAVYPAQTIAAGQITISPAASKVEAGLPYYSVLETMPPEVPVQGTSQGRMKHFAEIGVKLDSSLGCFVEDEEVPFRSSQDLMDTPPPIFTGDIKISNVGRDATASVRVEQRQPLPLTVVSVFGTLGTGE